jgi:hypothetical protein
MTTAVLNITGEFFWTNMPHGPSMDTGPFTGEIIGGLERACYPRERNSHERIIGVVGEKEDTVFAICPGLGPV